LRVMNLLRLFRKQDGTALVMVMGILAVLTISGTTMMVYTSQNTKTASRSKVDETSFSLSEAALNNAMAVLANPTNNALDPDVLPDTEAEASTAVYENGTAKWYGVLDRSTAVWTITALGLYDNPTGSAGVRRKLTAKVPVTPNLSQPSNNPAWNYIYARGTGNTCDVDLANNLAGSSQFYIAGNLCLRQNVGITSSSLIVRGNLDLENNAYVGASTSMSTRVETFVGGQCRYAGGAWGSPCSGNQDARKIFSKMNPPSYIVGVNNAAPVIPEPEADFAAWYENAIPGPSQSCTNSSGTPPAFDNNYASRDNSVPSVFELTPASSYKCRVGPGASSTLAGAMSSSQTTLSVGSAAGFPTGTFRIRIDNEYMNVTGGFGTTSWTVQRGVNGSTAASHVINQTVLWDTPPSGEISWNATTKMLNVAGTIFIDGSAKITNGALNQYIGQGTIYLSGTLLIGNGSKLCGGVSGSECDFANWNPNTQMLTFVANGTGGQAETGNGILMDNNGQFQGGLFATNAVDFRNNSRSDGPIIGSTVKFNNNVQNDQFPTITVVPVGMPGSDIVYAQPNPPQMFAG
jgi:hypothetical protein